MKADRFNEGKPPISMVLEAPNALLGAARVLSYGAATKYARRNWQKGLPVTELIDSMGRHILKYLSGQDVDTESGELHIDHITVNALFLGEMGRRAECDDRAVGTTVSTPADDSDDAHQEWVDEVRNGDTVLGFYDWMRHQQESTQSERAPTTDDIYRMVTDFIRGTGPASEASPNT